MILSLRSLRELPELKYLPRPFNTWQPDTLFSTLLYSLHIECTSLIHSIRHKSYLFSMICKQIWSRSIKNQNPYQKQEGYEFDLIKREILHSIPYLFFLHVKSSQRSQYWYPSLFLFECINPFNLVHNIGVAKQWHLPQQKTALEHCFFNSSEPFNLFNKAFTYSSPCAKISKIKIQQRRFKDSQRALTFLIHLVWQPSSLIVRDIPYDEAQGLYTSLDERWGTRFRCIGNVYNVIDANLKQIWSWVEHSSRIIIWISKGKDVKIEKVLIEAIASVNNLGRYLIESVKFVASKVKSCINEVSTSCGSYIRITVASQY